MVRTYRPLKQLAQMFVDLVPGDYRAQLVETARGTLPTGTPYVDLVFIIREGEHTGQRVNRRLWVTPNATRRTRAEMEKAGLEEQHTGPLRRPLECRIDVVTKKSGRGHSYSAVEHFDVLGPAETEKSQLLQKGDPGSAQPVPAGSYEAALVETRFGEAGVAPPFIDLVFTIAKGGSHGQEVLRRLWLAPGAAHVTEPELERAGIDIDNPHFGRLARPVQCDIHVAVRTSNAGNTLSAVTFWRPLEPIEVDEAVDEEVALENALDEIAQGFADGDGHE